MLHLRDLNVFYGGIHALKGVSLSVSKGSIVTLIGANGAGKTTTLRSVVGLVKLSSGSILFEDQELVSMETHRIVRRGIGVSPEGRRVFSNLTVLENLEMGAFHMRSKDLKGHCDWIYELFPRLKERQKQLAGTLSGGEQQMLALGRALMSRPKLVLLDEPSLGLAPLVVEEVFRTIVRINREGATILLVEQNAAASLGIADYAYVLETGRVTLDGTGKELLKDERVRKAYLGE